jgi:hypothetical protein
MYESKQHTLASIAELLAVSRPTIYRALRAEAARR